MLFATVVAVAGKLMMLGAARWPTVERIVRRLLLLFCVGGLAYAVVKVGAQVDLNATIADLLGISPADSWQGRSLFDPTHPGRTYSSAARGDYLLGVRERNWKYIHNATTGHGRLFALARDPHEQVNVAVERSDVAGRLRQRLAAWLKSDELRRAEGHPSNRR